MTKQPLIMKTKVTLDPTVPVCNVRQYYSDEVDRVVMTLTCAHCPSAGQFILKGLCKIVKNS